MDKAQDNMVVVDQLRLKRLDPEEMILFGGFKRQVQQYKNQP